MRIPGATCALVFAAAPALAEEAAAAPPAPDAASSPAAPEAAPAEPGPGGSPHGATLAGWRDRVWDRISDRGGNLGGRWDGVLQPWRWEDWSEYRLYERAYAPTLDEERRWHLMARGLRLYMGSADHPRLPMWMEARQDFEMGSNWRLGFLFRREQTLESDRNLTVFSFEWRHPRVTVFIAPQVHFYKPETDLEAGAETRLGPLRLRAALGWLDTFSDLAFWLDEVLNVQQREIVDYRSPPLTLRIDAEGAFAWLRFEAFAGAVMPHSVAVRHPFTTGADFVHNQEAHYAGGLAEARPHGSLVTGLFAGAVRAVSGPLEEAEARAGLFATWEHVAGVRLLGRLERVARPQRRPGWARDETETYASLEAGWRPDGYGFVLGYAFSGARVEESGRAPRDFGDHQIKLRFEMRFERVWARLGAGVDLSQDPMALGLYDGGNLVLYAGW